MFSTVHNGGSEKKIATGHYKLSGYKLANYIFRPNLAEKIETSIFEYFQQFFFNI